MYFAQIFEKLLKIFGIIKLDEGKDKEKRKNIYKKDKNR